MPDFTLICGVKICSITVAYNCHYHFHRSARHCFLLFLLPASDLPLAFLSAAPWPLRPSLELELPLACFGLGPLSIGSIFVVCAWVSELAGPTAGPSEIFLNCRFLLLESHDSHTRTAFVKVVVVRRFIRQNFKVNLKNYQNFQLRLSL